MDRDQILVTEVDEDGVAYEVQLRDINLTTGREEAVAPKPGTLLVLHMVNEGPGWVEPAFFLDDRRYNFGMQAPSSEPYTFTWRLREGGEQLAINLTPMDENARVALYVDSTCTCNVKQFHGGGSNDLGAKLVGGPRVFPVETQSAIRLAVPNPEFPGLELTALNFWGDVVERSTRYIDGEFVLDLGDANGVYYLLVESPKGNFRTLTAAHATLALYEVPIPDETATTPSPLGLITILGVAALMRRQAP